MAETAAVRRRLLGFALGEGWRRASLRYHGSFFYKPRYAGPTPDRLLIAPTDLRTSDSTLAHDFYAGRFVFHGVSVDASGMPVFAVEPPNEVWARELHGFGWLRHLRASELKVSRSNARSLVRDWIRIGGRNHPVAFEPEVAARRVLSWLSQSPLVLEGSDQAFYKRFMKSLTSQVRSLRRIAMDGPHGVPRLTMIMALTAAAVALPDQDRFLRQAGKWLDAELGRQILPDGGHISRNPATILELLADMLPLRQAFTARGMQPPPGLIAAIDRMMPMVRFFRHGDGAFARFNGAGDTPVDLIATILAYDDARGVPVNNAPHSGYQRMAAGDTVVIADVGPPPPIEISGEAHAGCLSFELSSGRQRIIVNCGSVGAPGTRLKRLSRTTAAHSTVTVNDCSSCRFLVETPISRRFGEIIAEGPGDVRIEREDEDGSAVIAGSHDGYAERFGIIHERRLRMSPSGHRVDGLDHFRPIAGGKMSIGAGKDGFAIRFHLHPSVRPQLLEGGNSVLLTLGDGESWQFASDHPAELEDSIFFSATHGSRRSKQIVLNGRPQLRDAASWWLQRVGLSTASGRRREG